MSHRSAGRWLAIFLALAALAGPAARGEQKIRLRDVDAAGDRCVIDGSVDLNLMLTIAAPGQDAAKLPLNSRQREKYSEETLAVGPQGTGAVRRVYTIARAVTLNPSLQEKRSVSPLQGKTITIRRRNGKVSVTVSPGQLDQRDRAVLAKALDHSDQEFFPDRDVAVGEEWPVDARLVSQIFPEVQKAEVKYQLQEVVPFAGHRCARVHVTMEVTGQPSGMPVPMTIKLSGDLYHALDLKRTLSTELSGPVTVQGELPQNGIRVNMSGEGTMKIKEVRHWVKVRGQAVRTGG